MKTTLQTEPSHTLIIYLSEKERDMCFKFLIETKATTSDASTARQALIKAFELPPQPALK